MADNDERIENNEENERQNPNVINENLENVNVNNPLQNNFSLSTNLLSGVEAAKQSEILTGTKNKKRKRNIYETSEVFVNNKRKKYEKSINQKLFDQFIKTNVTDDENIKYQAKLLGQELNQEQIDFYRELMKTKVVYNKVGLPSNMCKNKMHFRYLLNTNLQISIMNDDKIFWYYMLCRNIEEVNNKVDVEFSGVKTKECLEIKTISVCSKTIKTADVLKQGYCQDFYPNKCYLTKNTIDIKDEKTFKENLAKSQSRDAIIANVPYYAWLASDIIIVDDDKNLDNVFARLKNVVLIEGKSNFKEGIKRRTLKSGKQGVFYNIHDIKIDDFIPSIASTNITLDTCIIYLDCELNTDTVLKSFNSQATRIQALGYPENMIFWDNLNSFVELLLVYITCFDVTEDLKKEIIEFSNEYYKYKNIINVWKSLYNLFESIVLNYYDSVTTRMSIDQVTKLFDKCINFETLYLNLTKHSSNQPILSLFTKMGNGCRLMSEFLYSNRVPETIMSIKRVATFIRTKTLPENITAEVLIHGVGMQCVESLYNGLFPLIPKIRSRCCYLGGVGNNYVTTENVNEVIMKITKEFSNVYKNQEKNEKELKKVTEEAKKKVESIIQNTLNVYSDGVFKGAANLVYNAVSKDYDIMNSLVDDIVTWMYDPDYLEYEKTNKLNFLTNPLFMQWLETFRRVAYVLLKYYNEPALQQITDSIKVTGSAAPPVNVDVPKDMDSIVKLTKMPEGLLNNTKAKSNPYSFIYSFVGNPKKQINDETRKAIVDEILAYNSLQ